jgi:hypothetical protein
VAPSARVRLIVLLLVAGAATFIPESNAFASPADHTTVGSGSIGIRLLAAPGASADNALADSYVVDRLAPGQSINRSVEIDNDTDANASVSVYAAAASIVRGSFAFAPGHSANMLSSWTSVSRGLIRMVPGTQAIDDLTIEVPADASAGEKDAVVWAQVAASPAAAGGVELVNRVGIRMYISIGPGGVPPSNFTVSSLSAERSVTGKPLVIATVRNSGPNTLDISGNLTLSKGPGGLGAGPFAVRLSEVLAPGVSEPATAQLNSELPRGPWEADLRLTSGFIHRSSVATIIFPSALDAAKRPVEAGFPTLVLIVVVLFVLLAITAFALLVSRRRMLRMRPL